MWRNDSWAYICAFLVYVSDILSYLLLDYNQKSILVLLLNNVLWNKNIKWNALKLWHDDIIVLFYFIQIKL